MSALLAAITLVGVQPATPTVKVDPLPRKPMLGAIMAPVEGGGGATVQSVFPDSTASKSNLKEGDVMVEIAGKPVTAPASVGPIFQTLKSGETVKARIKRGGKEETIDLHLVERVREKEGPGYNVIYTQAVSQGERMRVIITHPKKPGRHPVLFYVQGLGYVSLDNPLSQNSYMSNFLRAFADDYVTLRVDKPGCGDSEGGPNTAVSFWRESDIYVQALKAAKLYDFVDPKKCYIFGHSMGGIMGPITAAREPVAGVIVYGTVMEPWGKYLIRNVERQNGLAGATTEQILRSVENEKAFVKLCLEDGLSLEQVEKGNPALQGMVNGRRQGPGLAYFRSLVFHQELHNADMPSYWSRVNCPVLALHGEADFVSFEDDHVAIADYMNKIKPGWGTFKQVALSDHGFDRRTSFADSFNASTPTEMNPEVMKVVRQWIDGLK